MSPMPLGDWGCSSVGLDFTENRINKMTRNTKVWLGLLTATFVMFTFLLRRTSTNQTTSIPILQTLDDSPRSLAASDVVNDAESLEKLISEIIRPGEWQTIQSYSNGPSIKIVSVLTNGEGCKTYVYDGDGNLLPNTETNSSDLDSDDNPFGDQ
jgi:hypothetical protein